MTSERDFLETIAGDGDDAIPCGVPTYLADQAKIYARDPRQAGVDWLFGAHLGLAVGFGLHSLLGKGEDALLHGELTAEQYPMLTGKFGCANFNAIDIVELAIAAGARYVAIPVVAGDGFCLYNSACNDYNSVNSTANRDLFGELASTCEYHGIGLVAQFRLGRSLRRWPNGIAATAEAAMEYSCLVHEQLHELLTGYGPVAAVAFEGVAEANGLQPHVDLADLAKMAGMLQPNTLVAFEDNPCPDADFFSVATLEDTRALPPGKPVEITLPMTPQSRSFIAGQAGKHLKADDIWRQLRQTHAAQCGLLLNTALMPDGSLDLEDITTLLEVGRRLEKGGLPR